MTWATLLTNANAPAPAPTLEFELVPEVGARGVCLGRAGLSRRVISEASATDAAGGVHPEGLVLRQENGLCPSLQSCTSDSLLTMLKRMEVEIYLAKREMATFALALHQ